MAEERQSTPQWRHTAASLADVLEKDYPLSEGARLWLSGSAREEKPPLQRAPASAGRGSSLFGIAATGGTGKRGPQLLCPAGVRAGRGDPFGRAAEGHQARQKRGRHQRIANAHRDTAAIIGIIS